MKIKSRIEKLIFIICIFLILFNVIFDNNVVWAKTSKKNTTNTTNNTTQENNRRDTSKNPVSKAEAGQFIAEFAINFYKEYSSEVEYYDCNDIYVLAGVRKYPYNGEKDPNGNGKYRMDCVGWVSMNIHQATGLDHDGISNGNNGFIMPWTCTERGTGTGVGACAVNWFEGYQYGSMDELMPGDILNNSHHVMTYVGNGKIVHCAYGNLLYQDLSEYIETVDGIRYFCRLSDEGVAEINRINKLTTIFKGQGSTTGTYNGGDTTSPSNPNGSATDASGNQFEYQGTATGVFGATKYTFDWVVDKLVDILDWFVGITTYLNRMIFIGWTAVVESWINDLMEWITGETASLTIEKLVNNKVPMLDVNFFDFSTAGGVKIEKDSVMYVIRENIAMCYYIIRTISLVGLLLVLLYLGVRMAFASVAEQKAKYKEMLTSWVVSFLIVFFIHYFMIIILKLNSALIDLINATLAGGEESLYDSVRASAYAIQASVGWPALIMYVALVVLLVKFLVSYFKRFLVVGILTFMAPILGVLYAIDKIKDNKSQSLSNWVKEYSFNVLIQSVHALLYTLFVSLALNVLGASIRSGAISILLISFMLVAEGIFKKIFGIKSGSMKDIVKVTAALAGPKNIVKGFAKTNIKALKMTAKPITAPGKIYLSKVKDYKMSDKINNVKKSLDMAKASGNTSVKVGKHEYDLSELMADGENLNTYKTAKQLVEKDQALKTETKDQAKQMVGEAINTVAAKAETVAGIGIAVVDPEYGAAILANAHKHKINGINNETNKNRKYYKGKTKFVKNVMTAGAYKHIKNLQGEANRRNQKILDSKRNTSHEIAIKNSEKKIRKLLSRLNNDPNVNQKELKELYKDMTSMVTEDDAYDVICMMKLTKENSVTLKIMKHEDLYKKADSVVNQITDLQSLHEKVNELARSNIRLVDINKEEFEEGIKIELINTIAKETGKRKKDIRKSDIEQKLKDMNIEDKKKLVKQQMLNSMKLTESAEKIKEELEEENSNLSLENVEKIIDTIDETTELKINKVQYKKNFEEVIKSKIATEENIDVKSVTKEQINEHIKNITNKELAHQIQVAGGREGSMRKNRNVQKDEFMELAAELTKVRIHRAELRGVNENE